MKGSRINGTRLTHGQIAPVRAQLLAAQGGKCALCRKPITASEIAVLDHDHKTGAVRGTLHHSCNAVLGKVENAVGRFGLTKHFVEWCAGLGAYINRHKTTNITGYIYPTHKTEDEKRLARNAKAVKKRAAERAKRATK